MISESPKTPIGNTVSYLPVAAFLTKCDYRTVGDLCSDNESVRVSLEDLPTDPNLASALVDASGAFESAMFVGQRYQLADFQALPDGSPAQGLMYRILTKITLKYLFERRPDLTDQAIASEADNWLRLLARGENVFSFKESADAGLVEAQPETTFDVDRAHGVSVITRAFMGRRANRWGPRRGCYP